MRSLSIGAWIDGLPPKTPQVQAWATSIAQAGIHCATIVLNAGVEPYHMPRWDAATLALATEALRDLGLEVWWSFWIVATDMAIEEQVAALEGLLVESTPDGVEFDAEGNHDEAGWGPNGELMGQYMAEMLSQLTALPGRLAVTAIPPRAGIRPQDMALMEALAQVRPVEGRPQAYSQYQKNKAWTHNPLFRPARIQRHALDQWLPLIGDGPLSNVRCGLMAGFQRFPKPSPTGVDALRVALDTVRDHDIHEVSYWSWKLFKDRRDITGFLKRMGSQQTLPSV